MGRAIRGELLRIMRPRLLLVFIGGLAVLAAVFVVLNVRASAQQGQAGDDNVSFSTTLTAEELSSTKGPVALFEPIGGGLIPLATLALFATAFGADYRYRLLAQTFVRHPDRRQVFAGKLIALSVIAVLGMAAAAITALVAATAAASGGSIDSAAWLSGSALGSFAASVGNGLLEAVALGLVGAALAVALRAGGTALTAGLLYVLVVENLLVAALPGATPWLPVQLLNAVGDGGAPDIAYSRALLSSALIVALLLFSAGSLFAARDVME